MYDHLAKLLAERGVKTFLQNPNQLVVTSAIPNDPSGNSFWVTRFQAAWYLSTWLPAIYRVPAGQDVSEVCAAVLLSSPTAIYTVDIQIVGKFGLERLPDEQTDALLGELAGDLPSEEN